MDLKIKALIASMHKEGFSKQNIRFAILNKYKVELNILNKTIEEVCNG